MVLCFNLRILLLPLLGLLLINLLFFFNSCLTFISFLIFKLVYRLFILIYFIRLFRSFWYRLLDLINTGTLSPLWFYSLLAFSPIFYFLDFFYKIFVDVLIRFCRWEFCTEFLELFFRKFPSLLLLRYILMLVTLINLILRAFLLFFLVLL